jgi:hypothetical protein
MALAPQTGTVNADVGVGSGETSSSNAYEPPEGFAGLETADSAGDAYGQGADAEAESDSSGGTVVLRAEDDPNEAASHSHNGEVAFSVLSNDVHGGSPTVTITVAPERGTARVDEWGAILYDPPNNYVGPDSLKYTLTESGTTSNEATVSIDVTNSEPDANGDSFEGSRNGIITGDILANDSDYDYGDTLTITWSGDMEGGTLTWTGVGQFRYEPPTGNWSDPQGLVYRDGFGYKISDGFAYDTAKVEFTIYNSPPTVSSDDIVVPHSRPVTCGTVLGNDFDGDGDLLTAELVSGPAHAAAFTLNSDGSYSYEPLPIWVGTDRFTVRISDGFADVVADVEIQVYNSPPLAFGGSVNVTHDPTSPLIGNALANDSDPEGDILWAELVSGPTYAASFVLNPDGSFTYDPPLHWYGTDSFRYRASDHVAVTESTIVVEISDQPPTTIGLPDVYRGVPFLHTEVIDLGMFFDDPDDTDEELTYTVTNGNSSLVVDSLDTDTGELTLDFPNADGGTAQITVRATDPCGKYVEDTFDVYVVAVEDFQVEWHQPDGSWTVSPDDEVLWDDDELRWTASFGPKFPPYVESIEWLAAPWPVQDYPNAAWTVFASASGDAPAIGNPGAGIWAITPAVHFSGAVAMLQTPIERPVARIAEVKWTAHTYEDGLNSFSEDAGGAKAYPERLEWLPTAAVHNIVDVQVTITPVITDRNATLYLRVFDPDHYSSLPDFDTGAGPNDNVQAGGGAAQPGGSLDSSTVTLLAGTTSVTLQFVIDAKQPGNNFIVAAGGRQAWLNAYLFNDDGVTLITPPPGASYPIPQTSQTRQLTVWRTLHVEQDSMGPPEAGEHFDGAGGPNDDAAPGNLGTCGLFGTEAGEGPFGQPSLSWLATQMERANVTVEPLTVGNDPNDDAPFVRNLTEATFAEPGTSVRDASTSSSYWVVQIFAAYEHGVAVDFDWTFLDNPEDFVVGRTDAPDVPVNIYLETIWDVARTNQDAKTAGVIGSRIVLHEVIHRFGVASHAETVMDMDNNVVGDDEENVLSGSHLRQIITSDGPTH